MLLLHTTIIYTVTSLLYIDYKSRSKSKSIQKLWKVEAWRVAVNKKKKIFSYS